MRMETNRHFAVRLAALLAVITILLVTASEIPQFAFAKDKSIPVIDVWYGTQQTFGKSGQSQAWINVLGNASDHDTAVKSLQYRLNGAAPVDVRLGPDDRRLTRTGDFNIEIAWADVQPGKNTLVIEAVDHGGLKSTTNVTLMIYKRSLDLPFTIDWSKVSNAQDVLQIVDGKWTWDASGIRPVELGYDRFLTIGDANWTDYEVTVPVTIYGIDQNAFTQKAGGMHAGVSVDLRWLGHSDVPEKCPPPHCGWDPVGDFNKYWFKPDGNDYLGLKVKENETDFPTLPYHFEIGHTYIFKARVETTDQGNLYRMKVWDRDTQTEPSDWMFERLAQPGPAATDNPTHGAFSLVAHYSDVRFGNIQVTPIQ